MRTSTVNHPWRSIYGPSADQLRESCVYTFCVRWLFEERVNRQRERLFLPQTEAWETFRAVFSLFSLSLSLSLWLFVEHEAKVKCQSCWLVGQLYCCFLSLESCIAPQIKMATTRKRAMHTSWEAIYSEAWNLWTCSSLLVITSKKYRDISKKTIFLENVIDRLRWLWIEHLKVPIWSSPE